MDHAEEKILSYHANGLKKTSIWIYSDGEILKRNEWYGNGIKELEIPYKNDEPHGDFKRWTVYGDVIMTGNYKKGLRNGKWTSYFTNKKIEATRYYKKDHPVGDWEGVHFNQNKAFEEHYSDNGDSIGVWKKWYDNGNIKEENSCFKKNPKGELKRYTADGIIESETSCVNGKTEGMRIEYYSDGIKIKLQENYSFVQKISTSEATSVLDGARTFYYGNGNVMKQEYWKKGERDSLWRWFDSDGNQIVQSKIENGKRTDYGICNNLICAESTFVKNAEGEFILNGKLWHYKSGHSLRYEEIWESGEQRESRSFYPDSLGGKMASEGFWKNGKREGLWRNWYKNGVLMDSLHYVAGERHGEQFSYDSTGKLYMHKTEAGKNRPVIMHLVND